MWDLGTHRSHDYLTERGWLLRVGRDMSANSDPRNGFDVLTATHMLYILIASSMVSTGLTMNLPGCVLVCL